MRIFKIGLIVSLTTFTHTSFAQWETGHAPTDTVTHKRPDNRVRPFSFGHPKIFTTSFLKSLPSINLPTLNNDSIIKNLNEREKAKAEKYMKEIGETSMPMIGPYYSGGGIKDTIDLKAKAQYYKPDINNGKLWILKISSTTAIHLGFYFSKFDLPEGSYLHIYTSERSDFSGPYTPANNPKDKSKPIQFGVPPIPGNIVYLEYFESNNAAFQGTIIIANIIYDFR